MNTSMAYPNQFKVPGRWSHLDFNQIIYICSFVLESPLWLVAKGKISQAENVLRKMAKYNGVQGVNVSLTQQKPTLLVNGKPSVTEDTSANDNLVLYDVTRPDNPVTPDPVEVGHAKHLIIDPVLRKHFIICCFIW